MRLWALGAGLLAWGIGSAAYAEAWFGHQKFVSGGANCQSSTNRYDYTYDSATKVFTVRNSNGLMTTITVPADGMINKDFKSPSGNVLNVSGNVLTKELFISAPSFGCKWSTFPPKQ